MSMTLEEISKILLLRNPLPSLLAPPTSDYSKRISSTPWNEKLKDDINKLGSNSTVSCFLIACLHLLNDDIGSCHDIVERYGGHDLADYLHYVLHRREGDYWNAKWWTRQLKSEEFKSVYLSDKYEMYGNQKNIDKLSNNAKLVEAQKRAQGFVDRCEYIERMNDNEDKESLKQMQWDEMKTIFDYLRRQS